MDRIRLSRQTSMQFDLDKLACFIASKQWAALPENMSDPFCFNATLNYLRHNLIELPDLQSDIETKLNILSFSKKAQYKERVKLVGVIHSG